MPIPYEIIRSSRKTIAIQITPQGKVVVRCPSTMKKADILGFVDSKFQWILERLSRKQPDLPAFTEQELENLTRRAKAYLPERVRYFASRMQVTYGKITIRHQKTRWGSCSSRGNLNFNCLLMLVPAEVADYVVVHELCHRKQMNHSAAFWTEVEKILPDYRIRRKWLKENGDSLIGRLEAGI